MHVSFWYPAQLASISTQGPGVVRVFTPINRRKISIENLTLVMLNTFMNETLSKLFLVQVFYDKLAVTSKHVLIIIVTGRTV